jgi:uncharacterized protein YdcH (DUF465 family)
MDVPIGMCKPDPAGKSTGSFNGETCDEATRPQSPGFHAVWKNLFELEELKAHLMATNEEYRGLASQHSEFAHKLDELESLPHLTDQEQLEEVRLKKLKLRLKDQMEAIVSHSRPQVA